MTLQVVTPGLLTTIQDAGRPGYGHLGVPRGGAADPWSLAAANLLLGNAPGAAALELTLVGPELLVVDPVVVAIAGADLGGTATGRGNETRLRPGWAWHLPAGTMVRFDGPVDGETGARAYLSVPGGIDVPPVLGSRSTALAAGFGGLDGGGLRTGELVAAAASRPGRPAGPGPPAGPGVPTPLAAWPSASPHPLAVRGPVVRIVPGPDRGSLSDAFERLAGIEWRIDATSDRMGVRLEGPPLEGGSGSRLTTPTVQGAIQLPADGRPIVLLADHQPTGGYPVVAVVITADGPIIGQLGPASLVRFIPVTRPEAVSALADQRRGLADAGAALRDATTWEDLAREAGG